MRPMRVMVLFDLPTRTTAEKRHYMAFRKALLSRGFTMEQMSVYTRTALGRHAVDRLVGELSTIRPPSGRVTILVVTNKQYERRITLVNDNPIRQLQPKEEGQLTLTF